jgi:hypothetical protein
MNRRAEAERVKWETLAPLWPTLPGSWRQGAHDLPAWPVCPVCKIGMPLDAAGACCDCEGARLGPFIYYGKKRILLQGLAQIGKAGVNNMLYAIEQAQGDAYRLGQQRKAGIGGLRARMEAGL